LSPSVKRLTAVVLIALVPRAVAALALGNGFHFADEAGYADAGAARRARFLERPGQRDAPVSRSAIAQTSSKLVQWVPRRARPTQR
jgi:hypothetical protein